VLNCDSWVMFLKLHSLYFLMINVISIISIIYCMCLCRFLGKSVYINFILINKKQWPFHSILTAVLTPSSNSPGCLNLQYSEIEGILLHINNAPNEHLLEKGRKCSDSSILLPFIFNSSNKRFSNKILKQKTQNFKQCNRTKYCVKNSRVSSYCMVLYEKQLRG
jgi:hypothetical protein